MAWYAWLMIALLVVNFVFTVLGIGRPREPLTPVNALVVGVVNGVWVWGVVELAGG